MAISRRNFLKTSVLSAAAIQASRQALASDTEHIVVPKRKFGRYDDQVSVIGVGGHTLYLSGSQQDATAIAHKALDHGINFFDNSWDYHGGKAESYMGNAIAGRRDEVFLMSKFCIYHSRDYDNYSKNKKGAMKMLEDSLRRLKTDHLDLWMLHNVQRNDGDFVYDDDGPLEAMDLAKQQGKIRYNGFTGHSRAQIHIDLIQKGYPWDAMLIPVSALGAMSSRSFEKEVIPLCAEKEIAVLGMKGFAGSRRTELHTKTSAEEVLSYSLSYPQVCTHLIGIDKLEFMEKAIVASKTAPMTTDQRIQFALNKPTYPEDHYAMTHGGKHYESGCCGCEDHHHA